MTPDRQIYLLDPKELSPETIAVAFAKTSRSPLSFKEIADDLTDEKSAEFHEKWVVGYGHASVAEHAVLHVALENISRLAVECIESNRLASYTEKSTRYQKWDKQAFFTPPEFIDTPLSADYENTCRGLFETYQDSLPAIRSVIEKDNPRRENESENGWDMRIRSQYVDICRYLLPAASLANVGMTANARALEHAISKALSSPLGEIREIGESLKQVAQAEVPTLVKYANPLPYLQNTARNMHAAISGISPTHTQEDWCRLIDFDPDGEYKVLASALVRYGEMSFSDAYEYVRHAGADELKRLAAVVLQDMGQFDEPIREFEHTSYTFEIVLDQGAYFELKRHRMMTQNPQQLTTRLGYATPAAFIEAGFIDPYRLAMDKAAQTFEKIYAFNPDAASYIVPNAYLRRVLLTLNLRAAFHLCELRSSVNAHFAMRRTAQRIGEIIRTVHPILGGAIRTNPCETCGQIETEYFSR